jgi:hypothetical protein
MSPGPEETVTAGRDALGRFKRGNEGGPGRPRRAVETEYLAVIGDVVPLERWRRIVERAAADAEAGDAKARQWLAGSLLGSVPQSLLDVAAREWSEGWIIDREMVIRCAETVDSLTGGALTAGIRADKLKNAFKRNDPNPSDVFDDNSSTPDPSASGDR